MFYLKNNNEKSLIIAIVRIKGKQMRYYTGLSIDSKNWNKDINKAYSRRGELGKKLSKLNNKLVKIEEFINRYLDEIKYNNYNGSVIELKSKLTDKFKIKKEVETSFFKVYDLFLEFIKENKSFGTFKQHKSSKASVLDYNNKLTFNQINHSFYDSYLNFLFNQGKTDNTVGGKIVRLKTFLKWALKNNHHSNDSFLEFKSMSRDIDAVSLNWNELQLLKDVELTGLKERVRDLFLIGVLSGQRFSDYSVFNKADIQDGFIVKRAKKTLERSYIPLNVDSLPYLIELLEKYNWELPNIAQQVFNKNIKEVGRLAKINDPFKKINKRGNKIEEVVMPKFNFISSHTARRTFITVSLNRGINPLIVMRQVGINKLDTLKKYYKFDKQEMINQVGNVWRDF